MAEREGGVMTNIERIRNMTEEELVEYLGISAFCLKVGSCRSSHEETRCSICISTWLREEEEAED